MLRSFAIPAILIGLVCLPFVFPESGKDRTAVVENRNLNPTYPPASANPFSLASTPIQTQTSPSGFPMQYDQGRAIPATNPASANTAAAPIYDERGQLIGYAPEQGRGFGIPPGQPDYGAAETFVLPGNAYGPDWSAAPMEFVPVSDFNEVFRFDVTPLWIRGRWQRVSTSPVVDGLQGLRTALVTGTNSWDLHGSLTYFFDERQRCQRITFRGWAGDPNRLIQYLQRQHGFASEGGSGVGFYLAKRGRQRQGGLLMKLPAVSYSQNRTEQIALLLEINRKGSGYVLSEDFESLVKGSQIGF